MASEAQWEYLRQRMLKLGIEEGGIKESFILGSGSGGQKVNKTSSCVQLRWGKVEVKCQQSRSQQTNRFLAREELCRRVEETRKQAQLILKQERERERRKNRPISLNQKRKILEGKRKHGHKKRNRKSVDSQD